MEGVKPKILVTGGRGLVGSRVIELLSSSYEFLSLARRDGFDVTAPESFSKFSNQDAKVLIHFAAKTDVDGCESEKDLGKNSEAWQINVEGTRNTANFCLKNNIKIILISTDFVFDGKKSEGEGYTEEDIPSPVNWYSKTKFEAEKVVKEAGLDHIILRTAYPYRKEFAQKKDFVRIILERLQQGMEVKAITNHIMCPTFIDDLAPVINKLISIDARGIYHAVGSSPVSPHDAAAKIAEVYNLDKNLIKPISREEYFSGKAERPFNLYLKNDKINSLDLSMSSLEEGLEEIKK